MDLVVIEEFEELEEELDALEGQRRPKLYLRDQENPLEVLDDRTFRRKFRFTKETVVNVLLPTIFPPEVMQPNRRGLPIPPLLQVCVLLRYYASSSYQTVCADLFHISQATVHRISRRLSETICQSFDRFIRMPETREEIADTWRAFYQKARFPGVIGLIDGTHVPIMSPGGEQAEIFRNRKGSFSINVQLVCGPNEEIFDIVCRWPGSAHDSRVFDNSALKVRMERDYPRLGHLLGDAGYAQKAYLFTPVLDNPGSEIPLSNGDRRYNVAHKKTRSLVEHAIGRWKRRFPCLYFESQTKLSHTLRIITACAILFNMGLSAGDIWEEWDDDGQVLPHDDEPTAAPAAVNRGGAAIRTAFIHQHFNS